MANKKNLKVPTSAEARKNGRKGGIASGRARREKKAIQKLLTDILESDAISIPEVAELASQMGIECNKSVKEIFTIICLINSIKTADLSDLEKLAKLLGEETQYEDNNKDVVETLAVIRTCVYEDRETNIK